MDRRSLKGLLLGAHLLAPNARAAAPSSLRVEVNVCPGSGLNAAQATRAVRAELDADGVVLTPDGAEPASSQGTLSASVGCDAALSTVIRLRATGGERESQRKIVLGDAPASARLGVMALVA